MHPKTRKEVYDLLVVLWVIAIAILGVTLAGGCVSDSERVGMDTTERGFDRTVELQRQAAADFRELGLLLLDHGFQRFEETGVILMDHFFTRAEQWQAASLERLTEQVVEPRNWVPFAAIVFSSLAVVAIAGLIWRMKRGPTAFGTARQGRA